MICFPLDNTPYEAKDMGTYLATRTRGVFSAESNLTVTPGENGLSVSVSPGLAWLKWSDYWGTAALQEQALTLALDTADGALKRIDAIVCRLDKVNNRAEIVVKKGAPSSAPIVVPPVRDANYDELYIATVLIGAGVISISASAITDQRLNEEYCGLMRDGVTGIPTASLHAQAQQILTELTDALNAQIVRQSAEFDAWFDDLKGKLGEDPATALQLQVDNLNAAVVGYAFQASGSPVSIAYAGAQRIASITAYGENAQGGTTEAPVALTGISSITVNDDVTELPIPRPLRRVGDVRDVCVTRQEYEGTEKLVVTYNVGFVELDGTEDWKDGQPTEGGEVYFTLNSLQSNSGKLIGFSSHFPVITILANNTNQGVGAWNTALYLRWKALFTDVDSLKAYLAAQKAAGTPVQVAYQLATPETYATDPVDFDNTAGPLTVMTGGEVEVRMTELIGSRSPELAGKMDKATYDADGDGVVDRAADSVKLAGLTPIIDNPSSTNNRNTWYFPFTGTNNKDGTRKYYAALYADEATRAANKVGGGALVDTNDGRLSNARRASNITMGYDGNLWISYS
nr:MAG TPA: Receptor Binding Protein [Caudoviricetes sp.]